MKIKLSTIIVVISLVTYTVIGCSHTIPTDNDVVGFIQKESDAIVFHYEDRFSDSEKQKLEEWLNTTVSATQKLLGKYPFELHLYLHELLLHDPFFEMDVFVFCHKYEVLHHP